MHNPFSLKDKNLIITGASSGIGRQTAIAASQMGARIILIGRSETALQQTAEQCITETRVLSLDITNYEEVSVAVPSCIAEFGKIDGVVHAAGISTTLPLKNITAEKMQPFFETNVFAAIHLSKIVCSVGNYNKSSSSIIFISSVMGVVGELGKTIYSLTKGAVIAGSKSLALELASKNVRVNAISPGVVVTPMSQNAVYTQNQEAFEKTKSLHPLGLGEPTDIANACVFLLSDASKWITGINLIVDGGYTAK
ncbi:SDR family NAD(P)-dependent oxidoreductase [Flavobacterium aurantiibacter]|uniref:Short-chain dehydrogenase n=1 Tax=Flavobacterium aurantiibacter TaxID=2023067 RepID=A0A255ZR23_9FLAO|nr:SDR family oxidoreductase [Flavobacterium aurantiibacter]OYQ43943.1 short-chain dehydrogenase [Flavobacterium aurantiibacter]